MSTQVYNATGGGLKGLFPDPILALRNPVSTDIVSPTGAPYQIAQYWNNTLTDATFIYLGGGNWEQTASSTGTLLQLTGDSGTAVPTAGSIQIAGGDNVNVTATGSIVTVNLDSVVTGVTTITSGSYATSTAATNLSMANNTILAGGSNTNVPINLTAKGSGAIQVTGNLAFQTAGNKIVTPVGTTTAAGANAFGSVTLVGGTATIATTSVTASSLVRLSRGSIGATGAAILGFLTVGTISAATSFVINSVSQTDATSLQASDVSVVIWELIN